MSTQFPTLYFVVETPSAPGPARGAATFTTHPSYQPFPSTSCSGGGGGEDSAAGSTENTPSPTIDYFSHLVNFLHHPVISAQPYLQEKLLKILVTIVQDFFADLINKRQSHLQRQQAQEPGRLRDPVRPVVLTK